MVDFRLRRAAWVVRRGGVIAYPTEGVYGLGCNPLNAEAVYRLLALKKRPVGKGLILVAADIDQLSPFVIFPSPGIKERVRATWPGPVTWVLPVQGGVPAWLHGGRGSLAVRVSAHPPVVMLCRKTGPLVSTSANVAGRRPCRDAMAIHRQFGRALEDILPGELGGLSGPTPIYDGLTGKILRSS
ncbi:MAG TPA: Sua5/YciO/YrdC/YwlC family protein [Gammaproteobacteria bacterium]|nr:Sua5/YciO/YrdC/YwlC family protein [Gammaproteobacteria bacterium]